MYISRLKKEGQEIISLLCSLGSGCDRNAISGIQEFEYDVWYVDHLTFFLDLKILLMTVIKVFKKEGINSRNAATMERFIGTNRSND
ncbi:MAG: sugar transferase [Ginsengibacter sp.]